MVLHSIDFILWDSNSDRDGTDTRAAGAVRTTALGLGLASVHPEAGH